MYYLLIIIIIIIITAKTRLENKETTNHSWTASPKSRFRSLIWPQKTRRKGLDDDYDNNNNNNNE